MRIQSIGPLPIIETVNFAASTFTFLFVFAVEIIWQPPTAWGQGVGGYQLYSDFNVYNCPWASATRVWCNDDEESRARAGLVLN